MKKNELAKSLMKYKPGGPQIYAWTIKNDRLIKAKLNFVRAKEEELKLRVEEKENHYLKEIFSGSMKLCLMLEEIGLLFETEILSYKNLELEVKLLDNISSIERREYERAKPIIELAVGFTQEENKSYRDIYDLSVGGFSIVLAKSDRLLIPESEISLELKVFGKQYPIKCRRIKDEKLELYQIEDIPYAGRRVSFEFLELNKEMREQISGLIEANKNFQDS